MVSENHPKAPRNEDKKISSIDFEISNKAANHLSAMLNSSDSSGIRISLEDSGCSGYAYKLDLVKNIEESDFSGTINGINLYIHDKSFTFLKGTKLDFIQKNLNEELVFNNPNVSAECGCGESFNFDSTLATELSSI
ncbi:MAG: HesB/IscA family protein [Gammaproteobacteria bacterium]